MDLFAGGSPPLAARGQEGPSTKEQLREELRRFATEALRRELGDLRRKVRGDVADALRPLLAARQAQEAPAAASAALAAPWAPTSAAADGPTRSGELLERPPSTNSLELEVGSPLASWRPADEVRPSSQHGRTLQDQLLAPRDHEVAPPSSQLEVWAKRGARDPGALRELRAPPKGRLSGAFPRRSLMPPAATAASPSGCGSGAAAAAPRGAWRCGGAADKDGRRPPGDGEPKRARRTAHESLCLFVSSAHFDYLTSACVIVNAITMGIQTDWQARHVTNVIPLPFRAVEIAFCAIFTAELALRMAVHGRNFFARQHRKWHLFDSFLVGSQLAEETMNAVVQVRLARSDAQGHAGKTPNLGILRIMRVLRLIRVMRLVRILRLIGELRTLVMSILGSLKSLVWAVALLFAMMYVMGLYLTQLVLDHRLDQPGEPGAATADLVAYYGSLGDTILSVYEAVTGGLDWGTMLNPLRTQISVYLVPFFMLYIAFALLCMLNVITGVFVESALLTAKKDKDSYLVNNVRLLFDAVDTNRSGSLSWCEFKAAVGTREMQAVLAAIGIDVSEAEGLFRLLDAEDSGQIGAEEFVSGCARLRGPAKALELAICMRELARQANQFERHAQAVQRVLKWVGSAAEGGQPQGSQLARRAAQSPAARPPPRGLLKPLTPPGEPMTPLHVPFGPVELAEVEV